MLSVGFAGTPAFARTALAALLAAGHRVPVVMTQPDRPAGRGLKLQPSPVKQLALDHALSLAQPRGLRLDGRWADDAAAARDAVERAAPDVVVVAAYGLILPPWLLGLPRHGCINIHASLLPRWRGAAPVQRAIEAGDAETGVTIMQMDAGLDTGDMLLASALPIEAGDTAATLTDKLAEAGAALVVDALRRLEAGALAATPQPAQGATYAAKVDKSEAAVDWRDSAEAIERRLRAFDPFPGATAVVAGQPVKLWRGRVVAAGFAGEPGSLVAAGAVSTAGPVVACGSGAVEITELQLPGGRRIGGDVFLRQQAAGR